MTVATCVLDSLLIANRGEIACRILRTAKKLGIRVVSVYSDIDTHALHVKLADEAYRLEGVTSLDTYLNQTKILEIARDAKCQAIHPGYGFLSENVEFARACEQNGVLFVGPSSEAIRTMGIKRACASSPHRPLFSHNWSPLNASLPVRSMIHKSYWRDLFPTHVMLKFKS
uniref:Methylcrotonoyl-CoA carboxylase subunit alpha, mitochondrial n=1 Tax=Cacopsylla melanoneura TaxID=428564 RepID=A0A8D9F0F7_9HEMI